MLSYEEPHQQYSDDILNESSPIFLIFPNMLRFYEKSHIFFKSKMKFYGWNLLCSEDID